MRSKLVFSLLALLATSFFLVGGCSRTSDTKKVENVSGEWALTNTTTGATGTLKLYQGQNQLNGTFQSGGTTSTVRGSVSRNTLVMTLYLPEGQAVYAGRVESGTRLQGNWTAPDGTSGIWEADKI